MTSRQMQNDAPNGVVWFSDYTEDMVGGDRQDVKPPKDCNRIRTGFKYRFLSGVTGASAAFLSFFYTTFIMRPETVNRGILRECDDTGYFLYGNHTHPEGDVFGPIRFVMPKRLSAIISAANLRVPVLGRFLIPYGCLVVPDSPEGMRDFTNGIRDRIEKKNCVLIYPEAHVWPWCTFIRPFSEVSFHYPVDLSAPSFCMTTTYQKPRHGKKPRIVVYFDGPFMPDISLGRREARKRLHDDILSCMQERSKNSDYEYVKYMRKPEE